MAKLKEPPFMDLPNPDNRFWSQSWFEWLRDIWVRINERAVVVGTGIANHFVMFNADGDLVDSGKEVPDGEVVGTTDTQTLTNKTILRRVTEITDDTTLTDAYDFIKCDASNGAFTVILPSAVSYPGLVLDIKKIDDTRKEITVDAEDDETIDDGLTAVLTVKDESITIESDGDEWLII